MGLLLRQQRRLGEDAKAPATGSGSARAAASRTRGDVPCPAPGDQWTSVIEESCRPHSEKPEEFRELIEAYFPRLPNIS